MLFDAAPGQRVSLKGTNGMHGQVAGCDAYVSILDPTVNIAAGETCMEGSGFIDAIDVTSTGTFTILVDPRSTAIGSVTLTLYDVPADAGGSIVPDGAAQMANMTVPGQNGTFTFSGTQGQVVSFRGTNGTIFGQVTGCDVNVSVLDPAGATVTGPTCMEGSGFIDRTVLPETGTYRVSINPSGIATGSLTITAYDLVDATGSIAAGGPSTNVTTTEPAQRGLVTFDWCDHHAREHHPRLTDLGFVRHELAVQDVPPLVARA